MNVPVNSTSVITSQCHHWAFDTMQRSHPARNGLVHFAGVFSCRRIANSSSWSQHAFGNAIDHFANEADLETIAMNFEIQATRKTFANRKVEAPIHYIIWKEGKGGIWSPDRGWHDYSGFHPATHVHVDFLPEREGTPSCAK